MSAVRVLAFAGSLRKGSYNKKLAKQFAAAAERAGAQVTVLDLADYPMPIFDEDVEAEQFPERAAAFKEQLRQHDAFIIACPEYNSSITAALKNAIDWASRKTTDDEAPLEAFKGKVVALAAASPGGFGGLRGLVPVRMLLGNIGCLVLPQQLAIPHVQKVMAEDGSIGEEAIQKQVDSIAQALVDTATHQRVG